MISTLPFYQPPNHPEWFLKIPPPAFNIGDKVTSKYAISREATNEYDLDSDEGFGYVVGFTYANVHKVGELCSLGWIYLVYHSYIPELDRDEANYPPSVLKSKSARLFQHPGFELVKID